MPSLAEALSGSLQSAWWAPGPRPLSLALSPLAWTYRALLAGRRLAHAASGSSLTQLRAPVVVVGNLVVGGAGKTPVVIALVEALRRDGWTPGVIARGYGARAGGIRAARPDSTPAVVGDEPLLVARRTGVPVWVGSRRLQVAQALLEAHPEVNLIISDDGLQHLALPRQAQVVVFDGRGVGNGAVLPAGPLREPMTAAPPARTVVLYNASAPSTPWTGHCMARRLAPPLPLQDWWSDAGLGSLAPMDWQDLRGRDVLAAAGVAAPERFFAMLRDQGLQVTGLPLPDHADFTRVPWPAGDTPILVTEKDAVKLPVDHPDAARIGVVRLDSSVPTAALDELRALLPSVPLP